MRLSKIMIKLDLKDKKILYQLDLDCRQTNTEIGRKVGLSKQVVGFRIQRLLEQQAILKFYAVIDISKLGFTVHKNFLRLQNMNKEKEQEFFEYARNNPNVVWATSCDGKYDFIFSTWAEDVEYLNNVLKELNSRFGQFIYDRQTATILKGQYFSREYLIKKKRSTISSSSSFGAVPHKVKVDDTDWKILLALGEDARMSAVDIAAKAEISADAVSNRIRKLEKSGVLQRYMIVLNEQVVPYLHYKVLLSLKNNSDSIEHTLISYCSTYNSIVYIVKALGQWDFELDLEVESVEQFREAMMDLKNQFQNDLKDYSTLSICQVHKYNFCPSIPKRVSSY